LFRIYLSGQEAGKFTDLSNGDGDACAYPVEGAEVFIKRYMCISQKSFRCTIFVEEDEQIYHRNFNEYVLKYRETESSGNTCSNGMQLINRGRIRISSNSSISAVISKKRVREFPACISCSGGYCRLDGKKREIPSIDIVSIEAVYNEPSVKYKL